MTFNVNFVSPCLVPGILTISPPGGITASVDYLLTDTDEYQLPEFTVNYPICGLTYSFSVTPSLGTDGISFNSDASQRLFTYDFSFDVSYIQTYTITATALVTESASITEDVSWDLVVLYPCSNSNYVTISGSSPADQEYALFTESE